ncbi:MAG: hypothetical protein J6W06_11680 [Bacteroidales bacterium]|nr:hypothetical protein [Bacteroidales bacterium]
MADAVSGFLWLRRFSLALFLVSRLTPFLADAVSGFLWLRRFSLTLFLVSMAMPFLVSMADAVSGFYG